MARSAYGIQEEFLCADCLLTTCCTCCVVNQLYQTTSSFGNPTKDGGASYNVNPKKSDHQINDYWQKFCIALCCGSCVQGRLLEDAIGMPFGMGCCSVSTCLASNVIRFQYRLKPDTGNDFLEECFWPTIVESIFKGIECCCPCLICSGKGLWGAREMVELQHEVESRKTSASSKGYLVGYQVKDGAGSVAHDL